MRNEIEQLSVQERFAELGTSINDCMAADRHRLQREVDKIGNALKSGKSSATEALANITAQIEQSHARYLARAAALPSPAYPDALPIVEKRAEIARIIEKNQVVILCGETGSGKTTQIPKYAWDSSAAWRG